MKEVRGVRKVLKKEGRPVGTEHPMEGASLLG